jgi:hypothetical protein
MDIVEELTAYACKLEAAADDHVAQHEATLFRRAAAEIESLCK